MIYESIRDMKIKRYFIISDFLNTFIISIIQRDRPNNMNDDEVIEKFMTENYYSIKYEVIEINVNDYENVIL